MEMMEVEIKLTFQRGQHLPMVCMFSPFENIYESAQLGSFICTDSFMSYSYLFHGLYATNICNLSFLLSN